MSTNVDGTMQGEMQVRVQELPCVKHWFWAEVGRCSEIEQYRVRHGSKKRRIGIGQELRTAARKTKFLHMKHLCNTTSLFYLKDLRIESLKP